MPEKYQTLRTIYELIRKDDHPLSRIVNPRDIILRLDLGWDVIVSHLYELKADGLLEIQQLNVALISLTNKGIEQAMATTRNAAA